MSYARGDNARVIATYKSSISVNTRHVNLTQREMTLLESYLSSRAN